jgi:hypothetical protein
MLLRIRNTPTTRDEHTITGNPGINLIHLTKRILLSEIRVDAYKQEAAFQ